MFLGYSWREWIAMVLISLVLGTFFGLVIDPPLSIILSLIAGYCTPSMVREFRTVERE